MFLSIFILLNCILCFVQIVFSVFCIDTFDGYIWCFLDGDYVQISFSYWFITLALLVLRWSVYVWSHSWHWSKWRGVHNVVIDTFDCYIWWLWYIIGEDIREVNDVWIRNKYSNTWKWSQNVKNVALSFSMEKTH